ncbi:MAG: gliding motility-associated lipoprotein, partial [Sphingobacteriaceae bacterium]
MKNIYFGVLFILLAAFSSCMSGSDRGEVRGVSGRFFKQEQPYGMVYIPGGSFLMGQTDQDVTFAQTAQNKQVTVAPFFMDETETTNAKYKQFVNTVRDS